MEKIELVVAKDKVYFSAALLAVVGVFVFFFVLNPLLLASSQPRHEAKLVGTETSKETALLAGPADAEEIFEMIVCPCCGSPISAACCGAAIQRQNYVTGLVDAGSSKMEILLLASKKYGMDSILDGQVLQEIKEELIKNAPADRPIISIEPAVSDLGEVSFAAGEASTTFAIKNEGKTDLVIDGMETSCGCTTATVLLDGEESPRFGMPGHGLEMPEGWSATIAPGESAVLKVYYDPTVHPDLRGPVTRTISVYSNDPINFGANVRIEANQVD